jgi:hypothetical protein
MTEARCNNAGKAIKSLAEVETPFSADHMLADTNAVLSGRRRGAIHSMSLLRS